MSPCIDFMTHCADLFKLKKHTNYFVNHIFNLCSVSWIQIKMSSMYEDEALL